MPEDPGLAYQRLVQTVTGHPEDAGSWYSLGCALSDMRRWGSAVGCFARSDELMSGNVPCMANLGWNLHLAGRSEDGLEWLRRAVAKAPGEGLAHMQLSQVLGCLGDDEGMFKHALLGVQLRPELAVNRVALAFALFRTGRWREAWREFEARFSYKLPEFNTRPFPLWRGERVRTLFIEAEQGTGDSIFCARWFGQCLERVGRIILYCQKELYELFKSRFGSELFEVQPIPQPLPLADAWLPMMSIPIALGLEAPYWGEAYL